MFPCAYNVPAVKPSATKKSGCQQVETQLYAGSKESIRNPLADAAPSEPSDRYRQLCDLWVKVEASGPAPFEPEIDRIRQHRDFSEAERDVVAKIFRRGFEAALLKADQHQTWAYQRLLRRLLVGQPLDCPIIGDNPYATLNQRAMPVLTLESDTHELRGIFAVEEGAKGDEPTERFGVARSARPKRLAYAIAINLVAVALWLGPLNDSGRVQPQQHLPRPNEGADMQQERSADIAAPAIGVALPNLDGTDRLENGSPTVHSSDRATVVAAPLFDASKGTNVPLLPTNATLVARPAVKTAVPQLGAVLQAAQEIGLRNEPQHSAPKGEPLQPGTRLEVITTAGQWVKVRCESDGRVGYVRKEFVEPIAPAT